MFAKFLYRGLPTSVLLAVICVRAVLRHPCLRLMPGEWRVPGGLKGDVPL